MNAVEAIAKRIEEKPMPSLVAFQLLKVVEDEDYSLKDIVKIVETDASLTTEVLKVANSAAFFRGTSVTTVNRAVLVLGGMMVVGIAITASTAIIFQSPLEGYDSIAGEMWDHSLRCAVASRELAKFAKKPVPAGLAFTAGLLHDIGKSIISEFLSGHAEKMTSSCEAGTVSDYLEAERELVGTDHTQVGYSLAKHWGLPDVLSTAIKDHHSPSRVEDQYQPLVYAVHLGDVIAMMGGSGTGSDSLAYRIDLGYEDHFNVDREQLQEIMLDVEEDFVSLKQAIITD
ncbi:HDOD domain-containing protein [bacterium]|nr:HDOD domain-containing protein [bacterium]